MMTPSRISSASGAAGYYAKDDYYIEGEAGAPNLEWGGKAAADLGLEGRVSAEDLRSVLDGKNPDPDGPALTASENKAKHHAGWDFTFAVPKSVTLLVLAAEKHDPALADRLKEHIMGANQAAMGYLEENHAITRVRDKEGGVREVLTGNLLYGSVMHVTTRGGDPHIHVHNPIANATKNPETGQYGALETRQMYRWIQNTSLVAARDLQDRLMSEGFSVERKGTLAWEVAGSSEKLVAEFSSRSQEIKAAAEGLEAERGVEATAGQRTMLQKQTRKAKGEIVREALQAEWAERAEKADPGAMMRQLAARSVERGRDVTETVLGAMSTGVSRIRQVVRDLRGENERIDHYTVTVRDRDKEAQQLVTLGLKSAEEREAVFSKHLVMQKALMASSAGMTYERLKASFDRLVAAGAIKDADQKVVGAVTTERTLQREQEIIGAMEAGKGRAPALISRQDLNIALDPVTIKENTGMTLTGGQIAGAAMMLGSRDRYAVVEGFAGVGKSTSLRVTNDIAERNGFKLYGIASQHRFADEIRKTGVVARTVESFLRGAEAKLNAGGEEADRLKRDFSKTILIVDEASTLTNDTMLRLTRVAERLEIPAVRFLGDRGQLGGPGAGNPFKAIIDRGAERAEMGEILRQRHAPDHLRDAVQHMAHGRFKEGLAKLAPNILEVGKDGDNAAVAQKVVEAYLDQRQARDTQIVVATNAMRGLVSVQLREHLKSSGELGAREHDVARLYEKKLTRAEHLDARSYALGDKVVDHKGFQGVGTPRNMVETVIGIDQVNNLLKVRAEKGGERLIDLNAEADRKSPSFASFTERAHPIAAGEKMVWEARFGDRGYERGGAFTVLAVDSRSVTIRHEGEGKLAGKTETLSSRDEALRFSGYGYAMTADRAQGATFDGVVFELTSKVGEAANMARLYVQASRLSQDARMVTDDLARVSQLILQQDGQKPVALDHLRAAAEALKQDDRDRERDGQALEKDRDMSKDMGRGLDTSMSRGPDKQRSRTKEQQTSLQQQQGMGL